MLWAWFFNYISMFQMGSNNRGPALCVCSVLEKSFGYWRLCGQSMPTPFRLMTVHNIPFAH